MNYIDLVAVLAVLHLLMFAILVGRARGLFNAKTPAPSAPGVFDRAHRVQMNTLELMVAFLPALYIAARYWPASYVAAAGAVYLVGRLVYWRSYTAAPASRGIGFALSMVPILVLLIAAMVGIVRSGAA